MAWGGVRRTCRASTVLLSWILFQYRCIDLCFPNTSYTCMTTKQREHMTNDARHTFVGSSCSIFSYKMYLFKADMKSYIPLETAAIFFLANLHLKQGISSKHVMERKPRVTKWKILAYSGTRTHNPWITSLVPNPLGHQISYTIDNLKLIQENTGFHCAFIATAYHATE